MCVQEFVGALLFPSRNTFDLPYQHIAKAKYSTSQLTSFLKIGEVCGLECLICGRSSVLDALHDSYLIPFMTVNHRSKKPTKVKLKLHQVLAYTENTMVKIFAFGVITYCSSTQGVIFHKTDICLYWQFSVLCFLRYVIVSEAEVFMDFLRTLTKIQLNTNITYPCMAILLSNYEFIDIFNYSTLQSHF